MSSSTPMAGMRPVPGAPSGNTGSEDSTPALSSLSQDSTPQIGPTEQESNEQVLTMAKGLQDSVAKLAAMDPAFGKFSQRFNQLIMDYLSQRARKTGKMGGQDQPRY